MKNGFINVLKPPGMTSHDVVSYVRRVLGVKKAGHAGTLDPGAAGVLPVAVGRATRLAAQIGGASKSYRAEVVFGAETDSGDDLGTPVKTESGPMPDEASVARAVSSLTGAILQTPPVYSAVKIAGRRACDRARQKETVVLPPREVTIHRIEVVARDEARRTLLLDVDCSKGTYIRSLCRDLGRAAGMAAAMGFLVRSRVGAFALEAAHTLEALAALGEAAVEAPERYLGHLPRYALAEARVRPFLNGLSTRDASLSGTAGPIAVFCGEDFLGVGRFDEASASLLPETVYAAGRDA